MDPTTLVVSATSCTLDLVSKMDVEDPRNWWTLCSFEGWGWVARLIVWIDSCVLNVNRK